MKPVPISPPKSNRVKPEGTTTGCGGRWKFVGPVEDVADDEIELEETEEEDAQFLKCPGEPSPQQLEQHRASHLPYRSWCRWCVMGRGTGTSHSKLMRESTVPRVGVDYFFIIDGIVNFRQEVELTDDELEAKRWEGLVLKCVLVRD